MNQVNARVGETDLLQRSLSGEIIVVPRFLQQLQLDYTIRESILSAIGRIVAPATATALRKSGFDSIHEQISVEQMQHVVKLAENKLALKCPKLMHQTIKHGFAYDKPIWVMRRPLLRFFMPYDHTNAHRHSLSRFENTYAQGRLTPLRPHRDSWFTEPTRCVNIWIALGNVLKGNGISIYAENYGEPLNYEAHAGVTRAQAVCRPENFRIYEGDALLFHADHLHASELNRTSTTRSVLSFRVSLERPSQTSRNPVRYGKVNPNHVLSFASLHPLYGLMSITAQALLKRLKMLKMSRGAPRTHQTDIKNLVSRTPHDLPESIPLESLTPGKIAPASRHHCVVRLADDEVRLFDRYCPHQGADLMLAYLDSRSVVCPWHNLPFDIDTGKSACATLRELNVRRCPIVDGLVVLGGDRNH